MKLSAPRCALCVQHLLIDGVSLPLRCGKDEPHKVDVLESIVYDDAEAAAEMTAAAAASTVTESAGTPATAAAAAPKTSRVPLFAPYENVLYPLPYAHLESRYT